MKIQSFRTPRLQWLFETRLLESVDVYSVYEATQDWEKNGKPENWLIDCSFATSLDESSVLQGVQYLKHAKQQGLARIALVIAGDGNIAAMMIESRTGIVTKHFETREQAVQWYRAGCP